MTQFTNYLTEEITEDYADGIINRREALRRLGLLGVSLTVAVPLLAACDSGSGSDGGAPTDPSPSPTGPPPGSKPAGPAPVATTAITFAGPEGRELQGAWAPADHAKGAVLVIHENRGLTDHIRSVAGRLAASGYSALALDLLSEEGGTASFPGEAEVTATLNKIPDDRFVADMKAALTELERREKGAALGAMGFCFGGGMIWTLLAAGDPRIAAAVPFYGPLPEAAAFTGSPKAAVLAFYGEQDDRVTGTKDAADAALTAAGLPHELVVFPGAGHAFFNDTGARYNETAARSAYAKLLDWFGTHLT